MKPRFARELALISLPLLIIAGAAWLLAGSGRVLLPAPADDGPARLEFSPFEPVQVSAMDVYQGVDWSVKTGVQTKGKLRVPATLKLDTLVQVWTDDNRIVYRIGKTWKRAAALPGNVSEISQGLIAGGQTFNLHLQTVPRNAEEIRFRGKFTEEHEYVGVWPTGVKKPANYAKVGKWHSFTIESKPFDVPVQTPGQQRPQPTASRETGISVVKASYNGDSGNGMRVQLRRDAKFGKPEKNQGAAIVSLELLDAGRQLDYCDAAGNRMNSISVSYHVQERLNLPDTDYIFSPNLRVSKGDRPCGGAQNNREPRTLRAVIFDQQRWPITVDVPVPSSVAR